ncbi:hypothetical protein AtDm6_2285 [Acetobacter tropicalis]|uniref:Phosphatidate cytidylyltransferase n=2 Tax=Acetobacter tropicalis TaxID=104102 RepID=A0A094YNV6_9PROT|nr:hypothetical protein [Acetobacter tropicalis]KGB22274.1 hypothetical protein AtDm6_2285 [Acetobacter tropicalis]MDO8172958.1 hypothetical protein [Acetobacter tropicalis]
MAERLSGEQVNAHKMLSEQIHQELSTPVASEITEFVSAMLGAARPLGVLFYGSGLRSGVQEDTLLDFYVILRRQSDWPRPFLARMGNALLPPNVEYHEIEIGGRLLRAKVALLSLAQFRTLTGLQTWDTTVWARFSQPVRLVWAVDSQAAHALQQCVMRATITAALWSAWLGPESGQPEEFWNALYRRTYQAELRVEKAGRGAGIVASYQDRYDRLLLPCWRVAGLGVHENGGMLKPILSPAQKEKQEKAWGLRKNLGKPLNIVRLMKAAFTFSGGARYAAWKIERHSGITVVLTPFAEKHPLIAGLPLLWRLWRKGAFQKSR